MSDLISRKVVIEDIKDLLKSPYAHSQFGEASKEVGFAIRKEMAEIIIDLCVKRAEKSYDVDKVIEQLADKIDPNIDMDTGEHCNNWVVDMQNEIIGECIDIVRGELNNI